MDKKYEEMLLKGRMAETLVEELLKKSGNKVYRFGYEAIIQNLTQLDAHFDGKSQDGKRLRSIPDYVVVDSTGHPTFVEVKYRWDGKLGKKDPEVIEKIEHFWKSKIVFVSCAKKPFFRVSDPPYLEDGELVAKPILGETSWNIDPKLYGEFEDLVEKYLGRPNNDPHDRAY